VWRPGDGGEVVAVMELGGRALDLRRQEENEDGCGVPSWGLTLSLGPERCGRWSGKAGRWQ
jgi:hypothetical protein